MGALVGAVTATLAMFAGDQLENAVDITAEFAPVIAQCGRFGLFTVVDAWPFAVLTVAATVLDRRAGGVVLVLALLQRRGLRVPRWFLLVPTWIGADLRTVNRNIPTRSRQAGPTKGRTMTEQLIGKDDLPHLIGEQDLPGGGNARRFEGYRYADVPVSFFMVDSPPGGGPLLHYHPYEEIFITLEGEATFTVGDTTIVARAGQVVVAPAYVPHKFVNSGTGRLRQVDIHPSARIETVEVPEAA